MKKHITKVVEVDFDGEKHLAIEIPEELLKDMNLVDNEVLEWTLNENGSVHIHRTNIILNDAE